MIIIHNKNLCEATFRCRPGPPRNIDLREGCGPEARDIGPSNILFIFFSCLIMCYTCLRIFAYSKHCLYTCLRMFIYFYIYHFSIFPTCSINIYIFVYSHILYLFVFCHILSCRRPGLPCGFPRCWPSSYV